MNIYKYISLIIIITSLFVSGCSIGNKQKTEGLSIVTTIAPLYSLTKNITEGSNINVINIVPPGTSIHTFQITPSAAKDIESSNLIIINGVDLETFLEDTLEYHRDKIVDSSKNIDLIEINNYREGENSHSHGNHDPHIWLSPKNAIIQAKNIRDRVIELDPNNTDLYLSNFVSLEKELIELDQKITDTLLNLEIKNYIVFHNAYSYFEREYNIEPTTHIKASVNKEISPQDLRNIIDVIKSKNIEIVFTEPQFSPKLLETLQENYNLKLYVLDPLGEKIDKDSYFLMTENNLSNLQQAFK